MPDPITSAEIQVGKPNKAGLWTRVKEWIEDLNSRLSAVEAGATSRPVIPFDVIGVLKSGFIQDGVLHYRLDIAVNLLGLRVLVITAGGSGTLTIDLEYKRGAGAWTSVLTGPVSVDYTAGNLAQEDGDLAVTSLQAGDILRLNIDSVQDEMVDFHVYVENEVA